MVRLDRTYAPIPDPDLLIRCLNGPLTRRTTQSGGWELVAGQGASATGCVDLSNCAGRLQTV